MKTSRKKNVALISITIVILGGLGIYLYSIYSCDDSRGAENVVDLNNDNKPIELNDYGEKQQMDERRLDGSGNMIGE